MVFVDAHNLIKRYYHGGGYPYSLFYQLLVKYAGQSMEVVCDTRTSRNYRKGIYPDYKRGRNYGDDPVYWEVYKTCIDMARAMKLVTVIEVTDGEADDYIADQAADGDTVLSNDKDLWPLIDRGVTIMINGNTKVTYDMVQIKFNCSPQHIYLYKALVGDPSDKIPGKRGFGPVLWNKMDHVDRDLYTHHFRIGHCAYDPNLFTEQACMSWKLAIPYEHFEFNALNDITDKTPLEIASEKGVIL